MSSTDLMDQGCVTRQAPLEEELAWGRNRRGFWTKRRKSGLSMLLVLSLVAGIAVAFKLYNQRVPNNVVRDASNFQFDIWKKETTLIGKPGFAQPQPMETVYVEAGAPPKSAIFKSFFIDPLDNQEKPFQTFPGDSRTVLVAIDNRQNPVQRALKVFINVDEIVICRPARSGEGNSARCLGATGPGSPVEETVGSADYKRFLSYWTLDAGGCTNKLDSADFRRGSLVCQLGTVKADTVNGKPSVDQVTDSEAFKFVLSEADDGDQTAYKGWSVLFQVVFRVSPFQEAAALV